MLKLTAHYFYGPGNQQDDPRITVAPLTPDHP